MEKLQLLSMIPFQSDILGPRNTGHSLKHLCLRALSLLILRLSNGANDWHRLGEEETISPLRLS